MSRARDGQSIGEFRQVTRVVDSYSLGRIHRIALLDKEWCLGEFLLDLHITIHHHFVEDSGVVCFCETATKVRY